MTKPNKKKISWLISQKKKWLYNNRDIAKRLRKSATWKKLEKEKELIDSTISNI